MAGCWELNDEQWAVVEPILRPARRADNRGRPWHDTRAVLNGALWVLGTGAQWRELPSRAPKGSFAVGPTRRGKGTKIVAVAADNSFLSPYLSKALRLPSASLWKRSLPDQLPARLIGDKAYDSDPLDQKLADQYGIEMIAPNRRRRSRTQDVESSAAIAAAGR